MSTIKYILQTIFQWCAERIIRKYTPRIIFVAGSVGKTSTRDTLYTILSKKYFVRKSEKSFTAEFGLSHTIIGCSQITNSISHFFENIFLALRLLVWKVRYPDILILEIDCDKPGDIERTCAWLTPDVLVLTAIGSVPSHIELFGTLDIFLAEYYTLVESVNREGCIVYNCDDVQSAHVVTRASARLISCGLAPDTDISAGAPDIVYGTSGEYEFPVGITYTITSGGTVTLLGSLGISYVYAGLLSYAVAQQYGFSSDEILPILSRCKALPGRMNIVSGITNSIIIDDTYNASPIAYDQSIEMLKEIRAYGRKIAIVGDMLELGKFSTDAHREVGKSLVSVVSLCVCVGIRARYIAEALVSYGFDESQVIMCDSSSEVGEIVKNNIQSGDVILVKGSQSMRMERVVEALMKHPQDAKKILVRQDVGWKYRE